MKKVLAVLMAFAVMVSCMPFGMPVYAEGNADETAMLVKLDTQGLQRSDAGYVGSWKSEMVFDGNLGELTGTIDKDKNFYENRNKPGYVAIDLGAENIQFLRKIRYVPRFGFAERLNGAVFEGSYISATEGTETIAELSGHVQNKTDQSLTGPNGWFEIDIPDNINAYRYLRVMHPDTLNITEVEYYMAAGTDHLASLMAYQMDKAVITPAAATQAVQTLPALGEEEADYTVTYAVREGNAVIDGNQITYTPSQTEDLSVKVAVTVTSKTDSTDTRTVVAPITVKRHIKGMTKLEPTPNPNKPGEFLNIISSGYGNWSYNQNLVFDGNLGEIVGGGRNFYESRTDRDGLVGLDLGADSAPQIVRKIRYMPRFGFADRLNGAVFEGSNVGEGEGYEPLALALSGHVKNETDRNLNGGVNGWFEIDLPENVDAYRYLRLVQSTQRPLNLTELEFYVAGGADRAASLAAAQIGKEIPRPQSGEITTRPLPVLTGEEAETYAVSFEVTAGNEHAVIDGGNLVFTHPDSSEATATIAVTAVNKSDSTDTRTISLPVKIKQNIDNAGMLAADKSALDTAFRTAAGDSLTINGYMDLPTQTQYGSAVTWEVSGANAASVSLENNRLTSKEKDAAAKTVTLTATVSMNGASDTLTYSVAVNSGLQIWYKFDAGSVNENAKTVANSGVNTAIGAATLENGAAALQTIGAVYLNGGDRGTNSSHVKMPKNVVANITGDYTISFMMYKEGSSGWPFFIGNGNTNSNPWFGILPGEQVTYRFVPTNANNNKIDIITSDKHSNAWKNVALRYSGETMTLYVDGVEKGSKAVPYRLSEKFGSQTDAAMNFLGKTGWNDPYYKGLLSDFRIYSRALSVEEVTAIAGEKPTANYADWQAVAQCKSALQLEKTEDVIKDITLPAPPTGNTSSVTWTSSDTGVISSAGVIKKNADGGETATLTATITKGTAVTTKSFVITLGKGGDDEALAGMDLAWLNGTADVHYDFAANTLEAQDLILITLPKTAPKLSALTWTYDGKGVGAEGSALTDKGDTVQLLVWKSAAAEIRKQLTATINNGSANVTFQKDITAAKMDQIVIPASANAHSGTAKLEDKEGAVYKCLLTTQNGKMYFKFDISGINSTLAAANKKIVKAELQVHNYMGTNASPIIVREVAGGWNHGDHFGEINHDKTPIPAEQQKAAPEEIELAYVGEDAPVRGTALHDITYAFLNNLGTNATEYCLSLTNNSRFGETWPNGNSSAASIEKDDPVNWTRLVLTLADTNAELPAAYAEIIKPEYNIETLLAGKTLAAGAPVQLPTASITAPNPGYTPSAAEGEEIPETITLTGNWYPAYNATVDKNNGLIITDPTKDVIVSLQLNGYVKCFALEHDNFVAAQYQMTETPAGIALTRADNAGGGCIYRAVYDGSGQLVLAECKNLDTDLNWQNNACTVSFEAAAEGQTVRYYLWSEQLVPYL